MVFPGDGGAAPSHDRPFFRPDIFPSRYAACQRRALSRVASARRWSLLLLSRLLSAVVLGADPQRVAYRHFITPAFL